MIRAVAGMGAYRFQQCDRLYLKFLFFIKSTKTNYNSCHSHQTVTVPTAPEVAFLKSRRKSHNRVLKQFLLIVSCVLKDLIRYLAKSCNETMCIIAFIINI